MNSDETEQKKLTDLIVKYGKPVLSHSNMTVLFTHPVDHYVELYSISIDGSQLTLIDKSSRYCGSPCWSPDDTKIVYTKNKNDSSDDRNLILMDLLTKQTKTLTSTGDNIVPKISKNNTIVYCKRLDNQWDIYTMDINGNNNKLIISNAGKPVWSPDGRKIAYLSTIKNGSSQIFIANADGTNQKQLTSSYSSKVWPGWPPDGNYDPNWTPDGENIVYVSAADGDPEIFIMNANGSRKKQLTNNNARDEDPAVTNDGKFILFSSNRNPDMEVDIFVMSINGKNQTPLTNYPGRDIFPVEVK